MQTTQTGEWITVAEAVQLLGITRAAVHKRIATGKIPARWDDRPTPHGDRRMRVVDAEACRAMQDHHHTDVLTRDEVCAALGIRTTKFYSLVNSGKLPLVDTVINGSARRVALRSDVEALAAEN